MKILFENEIYGHNLLEEYGLDSYAYVDKKGLSKLPYVGYFYSAKIKDCIFILPKVFLKLDDRKKSEQKIVFGKSFTDNGKYVYANSVISLDGKDNILKRNNLDKMVYELSTWIYRAINKYWTRHPESDIIKRQSNQIVESINGKKDNTLLDLVLSLEKFHKDHSKLFTYITIVNSTGNNKIHWGKTISKVNPIIQDGVPYYLEFKNKNKIFNYDEELIVLFYSVLQYLRSENMTSIRPEVNYELIRPSKIQSMIENGRGTKLLRSIRRKYFKDELVQLWKLMFAFFSKAENIHSGKCSNEALLTSSFDRVFEDMVDVLVSHDFFADLKKNRDNKRIDHIYKGKSLVGDDDIFYIGDSKYYSDGSKIDDTSIYKQFTYAKNIIQENIDLLHKKTEIPGIRYRDETTDGYNLSPNFFIRGNFSLDKLKEKGKAYYDEMGLEEHEQKFDKNIHFKNRPFDRDTLLLQAYNINFLFVLASYLNNAKNDEIKKRLHKRFRADLINKYKQEYHFFKVKVKIDKKEFVRKHFYEYKGQMYGLENSNIIIFGFELSENTTHLKLMEGLLAKFKGEADVEEYELM